VIRNIYIEIMKCKRLSDYFPIQLEGAENMVDITDAMESKYLNADLVKASPTKTLKVMGEGNFEDVTYDNETTRRLTIPVHIDGKDKIWRPNRDSVSNLQKWGKDSKQWVGKSASLQVAKFKGKDSIIAMPIA
jgi:allophanate hydrolase subunit 1